MGIIRIILPPWNPCCIGSFAAVDMDTEQVLCAAAPGETVELPSDCAIDLGIALVRLGAPAVRLRFQAHPGRTYAVSWLSQGFGAGMDVTEATADASRQS